MTDGKILVLKLYIESSDFIYNYTGKLSKTILLTEAPELEYLFKPVKGFFKQVRVSPPISKGKAVIPVYVSKRVLKYELKPVLLNGEYTVEIGAQPGIVDTLYNRFKQVENAKTRVKFENAIVTYVVKDISVLEPGVSISHGGVVRIETVSPALLPNPLVPSQHVRRFTASPSAILWIPYMMSRGVMSYNQLEAEKAVLELEKCLSEHYSTRHRTVFVSYDGNREPALEVRAKYIITDQKCRDIIDKTLKVARIYGVGASRANGFGTITLN